MNKRITRFRTIVNYLFLSLQDGTDKSRIIEKANFFISDYNRNCGKVNLKKRVRILPFGNSDDLINWQTCLKYSIYEIQDESFGSKEIELYARGENHIHECLRLYMSESLYYQKIQRFYDSVMFYLAYFHLCEIEFLEEN